MGLAEPRKRIKISHDPNNLAWSESNSFGQKILSAQGWTPGSFLGARNARHSSHYSAANASHIRITYKDDNLGLGAKSKGKIGEHSRHFDAFHGLLGRLNGKSDTELQKEQRKGDDMRLALYAQGKWGGMQFVRGGLLVQGKDFKEGVEEKSQIEDQAVVEVVDPGEDSDASRRRKQEKKAKKEARKAAKEKLKNGVSEQSTTEGPEEIDSADKEERRRRKEAKRASKLQKAMETSKSDDKDADSSSKEDIKQKGVSTKKRKQQESVTTEANISAPNVETSISPVAIPSQDQSRPSIEHTSTARVSSPSILPRTGRHVLRSRHIQSKRMAFQDANGLDGIFMRQSQSQTKSD